MKYFIDGILKGIPYGALAGSLIALAVINPFNIIFILTSAFSLFTICIAIKAK